MAIRRPGGGSQLKLQRGGGEEEKGLRENGIDYVAVESIMSAPKSEKRAPDSCRGQERGE